jgi:agmatine deiminase
MTTRRIFLKQSALAAAVSVLGMAPGASARRVDTPRWSMPAEHSPHARTWMAFGASRAVWGRDLFHDVQRDLATIALAIARYEPVSMLVRPSERAVARELMGDAVTLVSCPLDDLWLRDTGPVFVVAEDGSPAAIDFRFNGWGGKQAVTHDHAIAGFVARQAGVPLVGSTLVLEGGAIEVDGEGTAMVTESSILNDNRNPGVGKAEAERELKRCLGVEKILWLPGIKGRDITDGHVDFYARFARPGVVAAAYEPDETAFDHAVTRRHLDILRSATDARGRRLEIVVLEAPSRVRPAFENDDFAAGYVNFYVCNGAVIAPEFGDPRADEAARLSLQQLFPDRDVVQINIDAIAAGGGGIHCTTQQEPRA